MHYDILLGGKYGAEARVETESAPSLQMSHLVLAGALVNVALGGFVFAVLLAAVGLVMMDWERPKKTIPSVTF